MAKLTDIVFDSLDPPGLVKFWPAALDDYAIRPYSERDTELLAEQNLAPDSNPAVAVDGPGPTLFFQKSNQSKTQRNRVHLDIRAANRSAEIERLKSFGARVRDVHDTFTVMLDPEGNEFCVVDLHTDADNDDA